MQPLKQRPSYNAYIETAEQMRAMCDALLGATRVALDTEFIRRNTFYPQGALLQLATDEEIYLIDLLALDAEDLALLKPCLCDPNILKVMHACWEDLEVFSLMFDEIPQPLMDTQIAAAFAGVDWSMGYHRLIQSTLGIDLPKSATLTNWLQRPLSNHQLEYAKDDVRYLLAALDVLEEKMQVLGTKAYCVEQCENFVEKYHASTDVSVYYTRLSHAHQLSHPQQALLQQLCMWREQQSQKRDLPRAWVVKDALLNLIVQKCYRQLEFDPQALSKLCKANPKLRKFETDIASLIEGFDPEQTASWPEKLDERVRFPKGHPALQWRNLLESISEESGIVAPMLLAKDDYFTCFVRNQESGQWEFVIPETWPQWKQSVVGEKLEQWWQTLGAEI